MKDYLSPEERTRLDELRATDAFAQDVLDEVDRILASTGFQRVQQHARDFLGYVVAKTLLGEADQIKEMTVAIAVFGESADFDPAENAKVRAAASELRRRLSAYASGAGRNDVIQIKLPLNTYVPVISGNRCVTS